MICPKCGKENADDSKFCEHCGAPLEAVVEEVKEEVKAAAEEVKEEAKEVQTEVKAEVERKAANIPTPKAPKDPNGKKGLDPKVLIAAVGAVAVIALIVILINVFSGGSSSGYKAGYMAVPDPDNECTYIINGGKQIAKVGENADVEPISVDGSVVLLVEEEDDEDTISVIKNGKVTKVGENINPIAFADTGAAFVFTNEDGDLMLYTVSSGKSEKIEGEIKSSRVAMSPDGKSVLYTKTDENDDGDEVTALYLYTGGKSSKIAKDGVYPVTLSNGAKQIYAYDVESESLVLYNAKGEKVGKIGSSASKSFIVNQDHTDIIFSDGEKTYISVKGDEKKKIASSSDVTPVLPDGVTVTYSRSYGAVYVYGVSNFKNIIISCYDSDSETDALYYLNSKYELENKIGDTSRAVTADGATVYYKKSGNLYSKNIKKADAEQVKIASNTKGNFVISSDGKTVYYISEDDELHSYKGGKDNKIADDVDKVYISGKDNVFFLSDDGVYYVSGSSKKAVATEALGMTVDPTGAVYVLKGDKDAYDVLYSNGSTSFKEILKGLSYGK